MFFHPAGCRNEFCAFQKQGYCELNKMFINKYGMCDNFVPIKLSIDKLIQAKNETREAYEFLKDEETKDEELFFKNPIL